MRELIIIRTGVTGIIGQEQQPMLNISVFGMMALVVFMIIVLVALFGRSASNGRGRIVALSVAALIGIPLLMIAFGLFFVRSGHKSDLHMLETRVVDVLQDSASAHGTRVNIERIQADRTRATVEVLPGQFRVLHAGNDGDSKRSSTIVILRSQAGFPVIEIINDEEETTRDQQGLLPVLASDAGTGTSRDVLTTSPAEPSSSRSAESRITEPHVSATSKDSGQSLRSNSQTSVASGTEPPAWVVLGGTTEDEFGSHVTVSSRPRLNLEEAQADAWAKVVNVLEQEFRRQNPEAEDWDLPETLVVHDEVILDEFDQIYLAEMTGGLTTPTHIMHYRVDRSPEALAKIRPYWQSELVNERLRGLGGVVGVITLCLAGVSGYLRYESRPNRCARKRLALAVVMALAVVLAAAIEFLR